MLTDDSHEVNPDYETETGGHTIPKKTIRLLVADDHPIFRGGLRALLALEGDFEIVGEAANGHEVLDQVRKLDPDVLLLDLRMPYLDGMGVLRALPSINTRTRVVLLTAVDDRNEFVEAMRLGCHGVMLKGTAAERIVECIRKVHAGEIWLDSATIAAVMHQFSSGPAATPASNNGMSKQERMKLPLSAREREVVAMVAQGYKNREMAEKMFISEQTVKNHLHSIFDKLGISDRLELALYAVHEVLSERDAPAGGSEPAPIAVPERMQSRRENRMENREEQTA